jgi:hypothetical protein
MIRIILMVASLCAFALTLYPLTDIASHADVRHREAWWAIPVLSLVAVLLFVNFFYLYSEKREPSAPPRRLARLFSLWLDAKESELRRRAGIKEKSNIEPISREQRK